MFRVWGLGFGVWDFGVGVRGLRVHGAFGYAGPCKVLCLEFSGEGWELGIPSNALPKLIIKPNPKLLNPDLNPKQPTFLRSYRRKS